MTKALDIPQKTGYLRVDFTYGNSAATHMRYTDWLGETNPDYTHEPGLEVKLGDNTGTFEEKITQIALPYGDAFTTLIASGDAVSPVFVRIDERHIDPLGAVSSDNLVLFKGRVSKVIRNYQGRMGAILLQALSVKSNLRVALGLIANVQCNWTFGSAPCGIDLGPLLQTGTCTTGTSDRHATITGLAAAPDATYWRRGYVTRDGLSLTIRDWSSSAPTSFTLSDRVPAEWIGQAVVLTPGCDKTIEICRSRWNNETRFQGCGYGMPDYHPIIEG